MEVKAISKYARISAFKCRDVTRAIQGLPAMEAQDILRLWPRKGAFLVAQTLRTAIANAENNHNLRLQNLVVKEAIVGEGPTIKRFRPKARGSAGRIRKRTSHIRIILTERQLEEPRKAPSQKAPKTGKARPEAAPSAEGESTGASGKE
jgi:large subunit ribosomal protein L22